MGLLDLVNSFIGRKASAGQVGAVTVGTTKYEAPSVAKRDLLKRYHQWVYACASKNSNAVAQSTLRLFATTSKGDPAVRAPHRILTTAQTKGVADRRAGSEIVEITAHPLLDLLRNVNENADEYESMELTELHMELSGDAYWYVDYDPILCIPSEIRILRPDLVKIVPDQDGGIKGYLYGVRPNQIALMPHEVVHFKMPNPMDPYYYGMSPLQAVIASDEQYQRTLEYEVALANNNAIPSLGIQYDGTIPGEEIKKIEADWNRALRGTARTGKVKVYDQRFEVKQFQLKPSELGFLEGRKWTREEIAGAYGVPLSLLTSMDVNLANAKVGERTYARWTIQPRLRRIEDRLNAALQGWYNEPRLFVNYDNPVPDDDQFELERTQRLAAGAIITRDEARAMQGFAPIGGEEGSSYIPSGPRTTDPVSSDRSLGMKTFAEHQFVMRDSSNFTDLRRVYDDFGRGIDAIYGVTEDRRVHIYAILFSSTIWTYEAAKLWIREHNYEPISRAPATDPLAKEISK